MKVAVVGGGVIGLTIAYRLAREGVAVCLYDQGTLGQEASWAGAGILPPANDQDPIHPLEQLQSLSNRLHRSLHAELLELTGIDNELNHSGGIYLATTVGEAASLLGTSHLWEKQGIDFQAIEPQDLSDWEPALTNVKSQVKRSLWVPGESQLRNPLHLDALIKACRLLGVEIFEKCEITGIVPEGPATLIGGHGKSDFDKICVAAGAWTSKLLGHISNCQVVPVKGHMLLYKLEQPPFARIINEGNRYVVPRKDGCVLVGSSEEETGFDKSTCEAEIQRLSTFALKLSRQFAREKLLKTWTGLRPMSYDQLPYIGRHSDYSNLFVAAGHFRSGLQLSTGTADIISKLILGQQVDFEWPLLRPER